MESKKFTVSHCIGRCVVLLGVSYRLIAATSPSSSVTWKVHSLRQLRCQLFCFRAFRQLPIRSDCPNASRAPPSLGHLNLLALHSFFAEIAGTRQVSILPHFGMAGDEPVAVRHENNKTQTHCSFAKCFANGIRAFLQSKQQHENPPRERVLPTTTSEPKAQVPSLLRMHASSLTQPGVCVAEPAPLLLWGLFGLTRVRYSPVTRPHSTKFHCELPDGMNDRKLSKSASPSRTEQRKQEKWHASPASNPALFHMHLFAGLTGVQ